MDAQALDYQAVTSEGDIYANLNDLRERMPVARAIEGFWVVTRYDDAAAIIKRTGKFSDHVTSDVTKLKDYEKLRPYGHGTVLEKWLLAQLQYTDPPLHTELRQSVQAEYSRKSLEGSVLGLTRSTCQGVLNKLRGRTDFDVVSELAVPYAVGVATKILGCPEKDVPTIYQRLTDLDKSDNSPMMMTPETMEQADAAIRKLRGYFRDLASAPRQEGGATEPLMLLPRREGEPVTEAAIDRALELLAGTGSIVGTVVTAFAALAAAPDQWAKVRDGRVAIPDAVEELLRYTSVASDAARFVVKPFTMHGVTFEQGEMVEIILRAANRDPRRFTNPDALDFDRSAKGHLVFGDGRHRCIGDHLTRIETQVVIEELVRTFSTLSLPAGGPQRLKDRIGIMGYENMPAAVTYRSAPA